MDQDLWYHSPSANRDFGLQKAPHLHAASAFRGHEWSYTLGAHHLSGQSRRAREAQVDAYPADPAAFDDFMLAADADMANGTPGTVFAKTGDGVWQQRATVTKAEQVNHFLAENADIRLTVVLLDGVWLKYGKKLSFSPRLSAGDGMDMGFDLAAPAGSTVRATGLAVKGLPDGEFGDQRTFQLAALFTPADTTVQRVIWTSDQPGIATVTDTGLLTITGVAGSFDLNCQWAGDPGRVMDYRAMRVSYDSLGGGTITEMRDSHIFETGGWESTTHPDADDPTVLDIDFTAANGTGFVYDNNTIHLEEGRRYQVSYDVRLASGGAQGGRFDIVIWGPGLYAGHELRLKDLSSQWQHVSYTFTLPASYTQDTVHLVCNIYDKPTGSAAVRVGNLRIVALDAGGGAGESAVARHA